MFDVYGLSGRIFTGPIDDLRDMHQVHAVARMRALQPVAPQESTSPGLLMAGEALEAVFIQDYVDLRQRGALNAYAQSQTSHVTRQPLVLVEQLMSRRLITVPVQATLAQGMALLAQAQVGQAPVVDDESRLVGLLLRADLLPLPADLLDLEAGGQAWRSWLQRPVADLMWTPVPAMRAEVPIRQAAQVLIDLHLPGLPVIDAEGQLLGFLSRSDVLRAITREPPLDLWS
jgi:CBS-domain-containing membrane protein